MPRGSINSQQLKDAIEKIEKKEETDHETSLNGDLNELVDRDIDHNEPGFNTKAVGETSNAQGEEGPTLTTTTFNNTYDNNMVYFDVGTTTDPINIPTMWENPFKNTDPIKDFTSDSPVVTYFQARMDHELFNDNNPSVCLKKKGWVYNYKKSLIKDKTKIRPSEHMIEKEYHIEPKTEEAIINYSNKFMGGVIDTLHLIRVFGATKNELYNIFFKHYIRNFNSFEMFDDLYDTENNTPRYDNTSFDSYRSINKPFVGRRDLCTMHVQPMILGDGKLGGVEHYYLWKLQNHKKMGE